MFPGLKKRLLLWKWLRCRNLQLTAVQELQVLVFDTLYLRAGGQMRAKHTDKGHCYEDPWGLQWELHLQKEALSNLELVFSSLANIWQSLQSCQSLKKQQAACRTGSFKCGNRGGLFSACIFKHAHMLVFYHPPYVHRPLLLFPSLPLLLFLRGEESSADCSSGLSPLYEQCFCGEKPS